MALAAAYVDKAWIAEQVGTPCLSLVFGLKVGTTATTTTNDCGGKLLPFHYNPTLSWGGDMAVPRMPKRRWNTAVCTL